MNDTAILSYDFRKIVTSKGQSGSPLHHIDEDGNYRTIGVHVGNLDNRNYSTILIKNVFFDFILPSLVKL